MKWWLLWIAFEIIWKIDGIFVIFVYSKVPAYLNVVDIAGLVKGAAEGQGLGNAFLSHISACDAIFHLCRTFIIERIKHSEIEWFSVVKNKIISSK